MSSICCLVKRPGSFWAAAALHCWKSQVYALKAFQLALLLGRTDHASTGTIDCAASIQVLPYKLQTQLAIDQAMREDRIDVCL